MDLEQKLTALWADTGSVVLTFNILRYSYYGMVILGYLIMIYLFFGPTMFIYFSIGTLAAIGVYVVIKAIGKPLIEAVKKFSP